MGFRVLGVSIWGFCGVFWLGIGSSMLASRVLLPLGFPGLPAAFKFCESPWAEKSRALHPNP